MNDTFKISINVISGNYYCYLDIESSTLTNNDLNKIKLIVGNYPQHIWYIIKKLNSWEFTGTGTDLICDMFIKNNNSLSLLEISLDEFLSKKDLDLIPLNMIN